MFKRNELTNSPFIIAEVGQNHQGDLDTARRYIKEFSEVGADAIKFQTRNNKFLFSDCAYNKPYDSENAFSDVYGLHREALELRPEWLPILIEDCRKFNVKFISTPFDEPSLELLCEVGVDAIKISSFDLGNLSFINKIAQKGLPIIMSIGGGNFEQIKASVDLIDNYDNELAVLHCVSEYPCTVDRLGLQNITLLDKKFPNATPGLSDHFNGIVTGPVGYMVGARVFEKHVTLDRSWKGTDHSFALERHGFRNFVRDIKRVPEMMKLKPENQLGKEQVFQKLGKSIIAASKINKGEVITIDNIMGRIFSQQHLPIRDSNKIIGKKVNKDIEKGGLILLKDLI